MARDIIGKIRRGLKKPPRYILERIWQEMRGQVERYLAPRRGQNLSLGQVLKDQQAASQSELWNRLAQCVYPAQVQMDPSQAEQICPGETTRVLAGAELVLKRQVDLLGSGPVELGCPVQWTQDYKTGRSWPNAYCHDIEYSNLDQPSDVKFPWEISRMQWMIPAGQAYVLTGKDQYAQAVRDLIEEWIDQNPYASSVNWACTMDVALRAITWTWFFHVFHASPAWSDEGFQAKFLKALWLHGDFTERHLEKSDINGNHYTADAAGLVVLGLFFDNMGAAKAWAANGWGILEDELPKQVFADGVDFEASVPYHRLVGELFWLPAYFRKLKGLPVSAAYRDRLMAMGAFVEGYSRADGSVPLWGDADDARTLPFLMYPINDHRYLLALLGHSFEADALLAATSGPRIEMLWWFGADVASTFPDRELRQDMVASTAFQDGGFYILRNAQDHVFVDCGPLGLGGRGGHGHNDILSFEAVLDGAHLISDCGAYLYTANAQERNNFRSTSYHNTPQIDGVEINRFQRPDYLWTLDNDAQHIVHGWAPDLAGRSSLEIGHSGYQKLPSPVMVRRVITLDHAAHVLQIVDSFEGQGTHDVCVPLHLAIGVTATVQKDHVLLAAAGRNFKITWDASEHWQCQIQPARVSPTYGVACSTEKLIWQRSGALQNLALMIAPA